MGADDIRFRDAPSLHLEKHCWPQICSQNLGGDDGVGRGSPDVASMQTLMASLSHGLDLSPFQGCGQVV